MNIVVSLILAYSLLAIGIVSIGISIQYAFGVQMIWGRDEDSRVISIGLVLAAILFVIPAMSLLLKPYSFSASTHEELCFVNGFFGLLAICVPGSSLQQALLWRFHYEREKAKAS